MKIFFYLLAAVSLALFVVSAFNLGHQLSSESVLTFPEIKGFEDTNPNDDYTRVLEKFRKKIEAKNLMGQHNQNNYFLCSFLVTILTAGGTLISAIQAAKKESTNAQKFAIILSILAFFSTTVNFTSTHFNDLKTDAFKKAGELNTRRSQFFQAYDKADATTKSTVIREYETELDS